MIVKEQKYILDKMSEIRAAIWKLQKRFEDRRLYRNTSNWERAIGGYLYPAVITDTIAAADGTVVLPGYGFWADRNTGMWRTPGNNIAFSINGFQYLEIENNNLDVDVPVHAIDGAAATPSYSFDADATMGFYRVGANSLGLSIGGVQRWGVSLVRTISTVPFRGPNGAVGAPSYSFIADTDCGMYYSATQLNFAVGGVQSFVITNVGGGTVTVDGLSLTGGAITDASGAISFGNENLATTSSITGGSLITGGNIGIAADTDLIQLTAANSIKFNGNIGVNTNPNASYAVQSYLRAENQTGLYSLYFTVENWWGSTGTYHNYAIGGIVYSLGGAGPSNNWGSTTIFRGEVRNQHANILTTSQGIFLDVGNSTATGSTTNNYVAWLRQKQQSGTIANGYDIYIATPLAGGVVTNDWCIYSAHNAPSYFAGRVGIGAQATSSQILNLTSTTAAMVVPRMTTAQRNAIAAIIDGMIIYNTTTTQFEGRAGGAWVGL